MSGAGFHVHGPHDHELEHAAQRGDKIRFSGQIVVMTAILATIGALCSYMGGATQANAGLYKNNAPIKKTEASNQWDYYQAKSSKQNLSESAVAQISIALAAIALLTRRKWLEWGMFGVAAVGIVLGGAAMMHL